MNLPGLPSLGQAWETLSLGFSVQGGGCKMLCYGADYTVLGPPTSSLSHHHLSQFSFDCFLHCFQGLPLCLVWRGMEK